MLSQLRMKVILIWCPAVAKLLHKKKIYQIIRGLTEYINTDGPIAKSGEIIKRAMMRSLLLRLRKTNIVSR